MKTTFLAMLFLVSLPLTGQPWMGVTGAFESGWWVYNKGFNAQAEFLGADRTRHAPMMSAGVAAGWRFDRFQCALELKQTMFDVTRMEASDHGSANPHIYAVAENHVTFLSYVLAAGYNVLESDWFSLWPRITAGSFGIQTTHPQQTKFTTRVCWAGGIEGAFKLGCHWYASASINHTIMAIGMKPALEGEQQRIFRSGFQASLCYRFRKCQTATGTLRS